MRILPVLLLFVCLFIPIKAQAYEGAGLLYSDLKGALPKALWRDQPRSEIVYLLKNLPANSSLKSLQTIKRNMLLSVYETSLIKNDIEIKDGEDLLTLRLLKLIEMGLWEDAFTLYTKTTDDPGDNDILAQTGVILILLNKGLSTACLEEKVLAPRFPDTDFWAQIDTICNAELGTNSIISTELSGSAVLQAIFNEPDFKLSADNIAALKKLSFFELEMLSRKKRIDYSKMYLRNDLPPILTKTFLKDPRTPSKHKASLEDIARHQGLLPESPLKADLKNIESSIHKASQNDLLALLSNKLQTGQIISEKAVKKLADLATENPENYYYIQILKASNATNTDININDDDFEAGVQALVGKNAKKVNLLKTLLDKSAEFSNNPANVYEKQGSLTPDGHYVMPTGGYAKWLKRTTNNRLAGLSLLIILSNIEVDANAVGDKPDNKTFNMLNSLSTVGLIDQSHLVAREELAKLMELNLRRK